MNAAVLSPDATRLKQIRASLAAIAPARWTRAHDAEGAFIEFTGEMGELLVLARFGDDASVDEVAFAADAPDMVGFLLRLLDASFGEIRQMREPRRHNHPAGQPMAHDVKNFAAECAMKCKDDPAFKVFLHEQHGLEKPLTDERVAQKVRSLLGVQSRKELNNGGRASEAWLALRGAFDAWRKAAR
ncbi:hypothetical protein [Mesorhizobium sp. M6A.T.Ce.TU.016.01.1.1]|uniref:hypothetical protein n=1 Tax=Mesorhizobium sp. M6A.T.Ce.TU.016.01.1.1 TaxID=2496783 RepID=UPI000FCAD88B|nr:hypothetical protein [Mesorhizobium sp. M6A.T.Ce.TU.016.01.1.1]RUU29745.1 hypothetical protein EOC94_12820 [Mesorhizobium sp. M6A.T.Ce.TU.016.01.1.1]